MSSCRWYSVNAFAYSVASRVARRGSEFSTENVRCRGPERPRPWRTPGTPSDRDRRSERRRAPVHHGGHSGELRPGIRNALWIVAPPQASCGSRSTSAEARYVGGLIQRDRDGRCRDEKDDQQEEELPSAQDSQVVQEARDDRPVGGGDVSVHGRHRAASSRGRQPGVQTDPAARDFRARRRAARRIDHRSSEALAYPVNDPTTRKLLPRYSNWRAPTCPKDQRRNASPRTLDQCATGARLASTKEIG